MRWLAGLMVGGFGFGLSGAEPASPPAPKRIDLPRLQAGLKIDGVLDEAVWAEAAVFPDFEFNDGSGQRCESTRLRAWYDQEALYLGWTCLDRDIQATFTARDSRFWEEEVVEFFVTAAGLETYFELQWNPLGGVFDAVIHNELKENGESRQFTGDWDFTAAGMRSAVKVEGTVQKSDDRDEFWQVEVAIPFRDLNLSAPKAGAVWRANFYRFNRTQGREVSKLSWSPTRLSGFHEPNRFGFLRFLGGKKE